MPDLLAHVLIAYAIGGILAWRYAWLTSAYVSVVMTGAFVPDLTKVSLVVSDDVIAAIVGVPFEWFALHTLGGCLLSIGIGVVLVAERERGRVAALLGVGAASHLIADALLLNPSGRSFPLLWPLSRYHPPTPGLYLSTDPEPTLVAAAAAGLVFVVSVLRAADSAE